MSSGAVVGVPSIPGTLLMMKGGMMMSRCVKTNTNGQSQTGAVDRPVNLDEVSLVFRLMRSVGIPGVF